MRDCFFASFLTAQIGLAHHFSLCTQLMQKSCKNYFFFICYTRVVTKVGTFCVEVRLYSKLCEIAGFSLCEIAG